MADHEPIDIVKLLEDGDINSTAAIAILYNGIIEIKYNVMSLQKSISDDLKELSKGQRQLAVNLQRTYQRLEKRVEYLEAQVDALNSPINQNLLHRISQLEMDSRSNPSLLRLLKTRPRETLAAMILFVVLVLILIESGIIETLLKYLG